MACNDCTCSPHSLLLTHSRPDPPPPPPRFPPRLSYAHAWYTSRGAFTYSNLCGRVNWCYNTLWYTVSHSSLNVTLPCILVSERGREKEPQAQLLSLRFVVAFIIPRPMHYFTVAPLCIRSELKVHALVTYCFDQTKLSFSKKNGWQLSLSLSLSVSLFFSLSLFLKVSSFSSFSSKLIFVKIRVFSRERVGQKSPNNSQLCPRWIITE